MCNQLLLSVLETVRTAESRSHDLTANPVALTQLGVYIYYVMGYILNAITERTNTFLS